MAYRCSSCRMWIPREGHARTCKHRVIAPVPTPTKRACTHPVDDFMPCAICEPERHSEVQR